ncbi:unnamed protein product [Calypogeia fissa]
MAADERAGNGGVERESRFVNLLQPNRDMATNWSVDVGRQLESYLDELKATGLFDDGDSPLNFAEAALLIQGSIQVYSKKVEYLYNLVLRALDYLAQKKQSQEGEKPSSKEDDNGCNAADEKEENFLNLDNEVPEEDDIDVLDEEGLDSITQHMKVPTSLLVTEGETPEMSGEAGELASYYVATCTMYRNFLLMDPSDTATVDKYLESEDNCRRESREDFAVPSNSAARGSPFIPSGDHEPRESAATENNMKTPGSIKTPGNIQSPRGMDVAEPDWQGDGDEGMMWGDPHVEDENEPSKDQDPANGQVPPNEAPAASNRGAVEDDNYIDPWVLLNPHEPGTLAIKPFKKGSTQRTVKPRKDRSSPASVAKQYGVFFPEFAKALQTREREDRARRRGEEPSNGENVRRSNDGQAGEMSRNRVRDEAYDEDMGDSENDFGAWDDFDAGGRNEDMAGDRAGGDNEDMAPPLDTPLEEQHVSPEDSTFFTPDQDSPNMEHVTGDENMSLEDLCRAHVDSILEKLAKSQVRSGLTARVTTWKNKIEATLKDDESRPPFDIHEYGDRLLATLSTVAATTNNQMDSEEVDESFTSLVHGQPKDQVARSFSALLQLVNNGNVSIDKGSVGSGSYCFSAENPFRVRLLNSQNRHKGMFQHIVAPSARATGRSRVSQQTDYAGPSQRVRSPVLVSETRSPIVSYSKTPCSGLRVESSTAIFLSPSSVRKSSRKRGQSAAGKVGVMHSENRGDGTPDKGYTPVKLTPNRRQSKRKPLHPIQA